ncbi:MAG: PEPxxWA-CTERM sorting domain-containing protein [Sphingomonadales bacterium]|nr:PEPxxWA-CTERM sorting domain-containing protein [Sphingomonadales bacterium]
MSVSKLLASAALAAGVLASPASAAVLTFNLKTAGGTQIDTFTLDSTAGLPSAAGIHYAFFNLLSDTRGFNSVYFGDSTTGQFGQLGIGSKVGSLNLVQQVIIERFATPFYAGTGNYAIPFQNGSYTAASGNVLTISGVAAVPEPATWAMFVVGFALLGSAMRSRTKVKTSVTFA